MIYDICGWIGMILMLLAYFLLSANRIKNGYLYQLINLVAATLMCIGLFPKKAWFSVALEIIWIIIAIVSMIRIKMKKGK